jgi:hypothetical protein
VITYNVLTPGVAVDLGAPEDLVEDLRAFGDWDYDSSGVFRCEDGVPVELLGSDGGEPEDQTLGRDWSWVAPALQAAYALGAAEGVKPVDSIRRDLPA